MLSSTAVFIGEATLVIRCAEIFAGAGHTVAAVITRDARVRAAAEARGLPVVDRSEAERTGYVGLDADYLFSVANLELLPDAVLGLAHKLAINFHDALLPRYAGLNATSWALINRETRHGVTWHEMAGGVDRGRIVRQSAFDVTADETALSLNAKCYEAGVASFAELVADISADRLRLEPQAGERSFYARARRPSAGATIDPAQSAEVSLALVRALDFGQYANPLGCPKLMIGGELLLARAGSLAESSSQACPGTIVAAGDQSLTVATASGDLRFTRLATVEGEPLPQDATDLVRLIGKRVTFPGPAEIREIDDVLRRAAASEPHWVAQLAAVRSTELPYPHRRTTVPRETATPFAVPLPSSNSPGDATAAIAGFAAWLARISGQDAITLGIENRSDAVRYGNATPWIASRLPLTIEVNPDTTPASLTFCISNGLQDLVSREPMARDLPARLGLVNATPLTALKACVVLGASDELQLPIGAEIALLVPPHADAAALFIDTSVFEPSVAETMGRHITEFLATFADHPDKRLRDITLLSSAEAAALARLNATETPVPADLRIEDAITAQVARTPDRIAVRCGSEQITYSAVEARAAELAARLRHRGAGPGTIVGLSLERSPDLVIALYAILKSGAAYLPLDPKYPHERLDFMLADSGAQVIVTTRDLANALALPDERTVLIDSADESLANQESANKPAAVIPGELAYLIYTSGSTGRPKGVMVTHANVLNFFAGMDQRVPHEPPGTWLAVTSLSFDISVLELLWTLARGFTVALHSDAPAIATAKSKSPGFSLFYFASDEGTDAASKYRLLLEGAKFADREGFEAIWTPERHFHAFGGLYPNSAITSAAIAAATTRVKIRAGSCVLPLHHPIRVAEDWALVDNLSGGRAGVSFASGWQPNDFVIRPETFKDRKNEMLRGIDTVRRLWRGERLPFPNADGKNVEIGTLPRPLQRDIPIWLTAARNPETFELAGQMGCHVLTHLLGMSLDEVAENIRIYRVAWAKAGHLGRGHVTLMLHTFVGEDDNEVCTAVRAPMKAYLVSAVDLVKQAAWSFPTFIQRAAATGKTPAEIFEKEAPTKAEMDALLEHAFERYYETSGLFGTIDTCLGMVGKATAIGVDEIACLIDFGVEANLALAQLPLLKAVMDRASETLHVAAPTSVAESIAASAATHLQCTPSMASMLVADAAGRSALQRLEVMLVGGEALPASLARQLRDQVPGALINMYGPTETTVWSTTARIDHTADDIPLGSPIANTRLYILGPDGQQTPDLVAGELVIAGDGVAAGYWQRPELTAERFIEEPGCDGTASRAYRTGDLVRRHPDGRLEFLGRIDHQVKIRGHRIELGEIESVLAATPGVRQAVVVARGEAGEQRLVAYLTTAPGATVDEASLRAVIGTKLPEIMVPAAFVVLQALPMTPNGKVDRNGLPDPRAAGIDTASAPAAGLEETVAAVWCEALGRAAVGRNENFFDIGGHSLLVVQVQRRLREVLGREVPITDMFRHTTIRTLSDHLGGQAPAETAIDKGLDRAKARLAVRQRGRTALVASRG